MKWCIIANDAPFLMEFLGKVSFHLLKEGGSCEVVFNNKFAEYAKAQYFPKEAKSISKVDWWLEHKNSLAQEYSGLTWRELYSNFNRTDTWPWGYEESVQRLDQEYRFFEYFLQTEVPDAILFEPPTGVGAGVAYLLSLRYDIPFLGVTDSRISGRLDVLDSEYTNRGYLATWLKLRAKDISPKERQFAGRFIAEFVSHKRVPSYFGTGKVRVTPFQYIRHYGKRLKEVGGPLLRYIWTRNRFKAVDFESEARLRTAFRAPGQLALNQLRIIQQKRLYARLNQGDQYYLFPLHLQPESSTSVQAMHYSDQAAAIQNIAFSLPFPCKLYVKEHPSALGTKPLSFYRKIQNIPNVKLITADEPMEKLTAHSEGVIALTGTAGMEASLAGKPTYILGNAFYEYHPLCRKVNNFEELREAIVADRRKGAQKENLEQDNMRFVVSYLRHTIPGVIPMAAAQQDQNNYRQIARDLQRIAHERKRSLRKHHS